MTHLYELAKNHQEAFNNLSEMDLPAEAINDTLEGLSGEVKDKCRSVAMWRENQLLVVKAKKELAKKITEDAKRIEEAANKTLEYLDFNMRLCGITEIDCDYFTIKYRSNPPKVISPEVVPQK